MKIRHLSYEEIIAPLKLNLEAATLNIIGLEAALVEAEIDEDFELEMQIRANLEYNKAVRDTTEMAIFMVN